MKIVTLTPQQFDNYAKNHVNRNYFQTSKYGNIMIKFGYNVNYLGIVNEANNIIGATLILSKIVFMKNKIAYAPRGILFDFTNKDATIQLVNELNQVLGKNNFMLLKMDPNDIQTIRDKKGNIINLNNSTNQIQANLTSIGFKFNGKNKYFESEKPRWECITLLNKDVKTMLNELPKRTRHKIRKAIISGVEILEGKEYLDKLYLLFKEKNKLPLTYYKELSKEFNSSVYISKLDTEKFVISSRKLYENEMHRNDKLSQKIQNMQLKETTRQKILNTKMESDKLLAIYKKYVVFSTQLLKKHPSGLILGGSITIDYDNATYIIAEGHDKNYSFINGNYLMRWEIIKKAKNNNFKYVNMGAIAGEFTNKNPYKGLNEMKLGYNGKAIEYIGEYEIILNKIAYMLYQKLKKK